MARLPLAAAVALHSSTTIVYERGSQLVMMRQQLVKLLLVGATYSLLHIVWMFGWENDDCREMNVPLEGLAPFLCWWISCYYYCYYRGKRYLSKLRKTVESKMKAFLRRKGYFTMLSLFERGKDIQDFAG